jgi:hypothetical protein
MLKLRYLIFILSLVFSLQAFSQEKDGGVKPHKAESSNPSVNYQIQPPAVAITLNGFPSQTLQTNTKDQTDHKNGESAWDKYTAIANVVMALFTAMLFGVGLWQRFDIKGSSEKQLGLMRDAIKDGVEATNLARLSLIADQRPWIPPNISLVSGLTWHDGAAQFTLLFTLKNTGKTPALFVNVDSEVFEASIPTKFAELQKRSSEKTRYREKEREGFIDVGQTIFPNEIKYQSCTMRLSAQAIEDADSAYKASFGRDALSSISIGIVGTISYYLDLDKLPRQTGFALQLTHPSREGVGDKFIVSGEDILRENLLLSDVHWPSPIIY